VRLRWVFWTILFVFVTGVTVSIIAIKTKEVNEVDIVALNELVKTIERDWELVGQGKYIGKESKPITILDDKGMVLYQSSNVYASSLNEAIRNRAIVMDLRNNEQIVGKLIVHDKDQEITQRMKDQLTVIVIIIFSIIAALCIVYILYINHTIFKPFKKLQNFAVHIAKGNLDVPLNIDRNNPFGAFTESFDIMREELAAARQSEYESNRSKKELVASLSHDIKTPVASIKAVSELMLLQATNERVVKQLNAIYAKAEQINLLVNDMFHATLEELQQLKVIVKEESSVVLNDMITNVSNDYQIKSARIPDCMILTDINRLQQVLDNVLSNAYKYAGTELSIESIINHSFLELHIMDYGEGVREEDLPLLFNKYYRGHNVGSLSGSGLGLYISKYFMQHMQGDMSCHNRSDGFTVTLKIKLAS